MCWIVPPSAKPEPARALDAATEASCRPKRESLLDGLCDEQVRSTGTSPQKNRVHDYVESVDAR